MSGVPSQQDNPFAVYVAKLANIGKNAQEPHHLLIDAARVMEDALVQASVSFAARQSAAKPTVALTLEHVTHILRDEDILSLKEEQDVNSYRALRDNVVLSSARELPMATARLAHEGITTLVTNCFADYERAVSGNRKRSDGGCGHATCRPFDLQQYGAVHAHGLANTQRWTDDEFAAHAVPLHNTTALSLPMEEEEVEESESESEYELEPDDSDYDEDEAEAKRARKEARAARPPPPVFVPFSVCCVVCHNRLLTAEQTHRVARNQIWSKNDVNVAQDDDDDGADGASSGNALTLDNGNAWTTPFPLWSLQDEAFVTDQNTSVGAHCARCHAYVGRYFRGIDMYRLTYINKRTGDNWCYFTGSGDVADLAPALVETVVAEGGLGDDEPQSALVYEGELELELLYQTVAQARVVPCPRYGVLLAQVLASRDVREVFGGSRLGIPLTAGSAQAEEAAVAAAAADAEGARMAAAAAAGENKRGKYSDSESEDEDEQDPVARRKAARALVRPGTASEITLLPERMGPQHKNAVSRRMILDQLADTADPEYALDAAMHPSIVAQDVNTLIRTDSTFAHRRAVDTVTIRVVELMRNFPTPAYARRHNPVVPVYLPFFVAQPSLQQAAGTARYVYHFLTGRDATVQKQRRFTLQKMRRLLRDASMPRVCLHMACGTESRGHRFVIVRMGPTARVFMSNANHADPNDNFTLLDWLNDAATTPSAAPAAGSWSRLLSVPQLLEFLALYNHAVMGDRAAWSQLFCRGRTPSADYDCGATSTTASASAAASGAASVASATSLALASPVLGPTVTFCYRVITDDFALLPRNQRKFEGNAI